MHGPAPSPARRPRFFAAASSGAALGLLSALGAQATLTSCAAGVGSSAVRVLGAGVMNDPSNKSLRFDILKFGLDTFCSEMLKGGAPLKFGDDEPVVGRFFAESCDSQVLDDEAHKSFVV